ncbi:TPA: hypothetical protein ACH3X1_005912 [Trebouxia sp. C0004]
MAAALSPGSLLVKPCCDRQVVGHSLHPRSSIAVAHPIRAPCSTVWQSSVSCQACTPSDTPGTDRNTGFGSSHFRAGPSGNAEAAENTSENLSSSIRDGNHSQHQEPHFSNHEGGPPVTSESLGTVVICGWLGSNKRYLKKYQDWWTDNRWEPVLFIVPMRGALTLGATAQELVEALVVQLAERKASWREPREWHLLFHCFSNTGWYTFGAVMEGLLKHAAALLQHVVGSVIDSAPHAQPCAKVWASGFASALLPRREATNQFRQNVYAWMECFFEQWLKGSPGKRLQQLAAVLQQYQNFPQLYIYSESDHVVPHTSVEDFMEGQSKLGRNVSGMRFQTSPHVDHFRNNTIAYTQGLRQFVADALALTDPLRPASTVMSQLHPAICTPDIL